MPTVVRKVKENLGLPYPTIRFREICSMKKTNNIKKNHSFLGWGSGDRVGLMVKCNSWILCVCVCACTCGSVFLNPQSVCVCVHAHVYVRFSTFSPVLDSSSLHITPSCVSWHEEEGHCQSPCDSGWATLLKENQKGLKVWSPLVVDHSTCWSVLRCSVCLRQSD